MPPSTGSTLSPRANFLLSWSTRMVPSSSPMRSARLASTAARKSAGTPSMRLCCPQRAVKASKCQLRLNAHWNCWIKFMKMLWIHTLVLRMWATIYLLYPRSKFRIPSGWCPHSMSPSLIPHSSFPPPRKKPWPSAPSTHLNFKTSLNSSPSPLFPLTNFFASIRTASILS